MRNHTSNTMLAMAYDRKDYKKYVMEKIRGAVIHFYMIHAAKRANLPKWTKHWGTEVDRLMFEIGAEVISPIKGKWDRRKAVREVIAEMREVDPLVRNWAINRVKSHHKLRRLRTHLPDELQEEFYKRVQDQVKRALDPESFEDEEE